MKKYIEVIDYLYWKYFFYFNLNKIFFEKNKKLNQKFLKI